MSLGPARDAIRFAVEAFSTSSGLTALARRLNRRTVTILAYHNVVRDEDANRGDSSLHLPLSVFRSHLDQLVETHEVVDLDAAATAPTGARPRAVITFDDAYRGAVTLGLAEIHARRLPAVVFASPTLMGEEATWWDQMGEAGILSIQRRSHALESLRGARDAVRAWAFPTQPPPRLPAAYGIATREELETHCGSTVSVGSHTWAHDYVPALDDSALRENLTRALSWVRGLRCRSSTWLALPFGAGSAGASRTALSVGHAGVLAISGGLWQPPGNAGSVPRVNIPSRTSPRGFEMRASGLRT